MVWKGHTTGVFERWDDCKKQVNGFTGALYKGFPTKSAAESAFKNSPYIYIGQNSEKKSAKKPFSFSDSELNSATLPEFDSLAVDAACSGNPGKMEYQGVHVWTKKVWFHNKFPVGTNNIGEFLAIVHAMAELKKQNLDIPIYTDSKIASGWIKRKKCATKLPETAKTKELFNLIRRAENWLANNTHKFKILKWDKELWGEIPADFGRK